MAFYIISSALLCPQKTFEGTFPEEPISTEGLYLRCAEPDYKQIIPPVRLRRMSHILKMGLAASYLCINQSEVRPDSIIVGTGQGCTIDLEGFMRSCSEGPEELLSPIPFINSGHNTLAGQIAMNSQIKGYNMTYLQEAASLESALSDAMLLLEEGTSTCTLVGAIDEYSPLSFDVFKPHNCWREEPVNNLSLLKADKSGSIMGEGAGFFCISNQPDKQNIELVAADSKMNFKLGASKEWVNNLLAQHQLTTDDIDYLFVGRKGDQLTDDASYTEIENLFPSATIAAYKHLSGQYPTAQAVALWMAVKVLSGHELPAYATYRAGAKTPKTILLYNNDLNSESVIIVKKG